MRSEMFTARRAAWIAAIVVALIATASATAHADTQRLAVLVGNNAGNDDKAALHFAETDAAKLARVLGELGGVPLDRMFVLQGKSLAALTETFARIQREVDALRRDPANRVIVMFYFSGHSDGEALELGRERLTFTELRTRLAALGADVRVVLIDSCKSGALLSAKGGVPGPRFQIRLTDELASIGEALLTSSAANEISLESREIAGSFFTHHLVSGLRGAADASRDGLVTLTEAYQYAYAHTIRTTGETVLGTQHPAYDYRLSGQGELVLTELGKRTAIIELPAGFDRVIVSDLVREQVVAEVTSDTHTRIAVISGRYAIRASRGGKLLMAEVTATEGTPRVVRGDELVPAVPAMTRSKGSVDKPAHLSSTDVILAAGISRPIAEAIGAVPSARFEVVTSPGLSFAFQIGSSPGDTSRETALGARVGYRRRFGGGVWTGWGGVEAGPGLIVQPRRAGDEQPVFLGFDGRRAATFAIGGVAGLSLHLVRGFSVAVMATLPAEIMKHEHRITALARPAGWLGVIGRL